MRNVLDHADKLAAAGFESLITQLREAQEKASKPRQIKIVVVELRGDKCRLGLEADRNTPIHRQEVYEAIKRSGVPRVVETKPAPIPAPVPAAPLAAFTR